MHVHTLVHAARGDKERETEQEGGRATDRGGGGWGAKGEMSGKAEMETARWKTVGGVESRREGMRCEGKTRGTFIHLGRDGRPERRKEGEDTKNWTARGEKWVKSLSDGHKGAEESSICTV